MPSGGRSDETYVGLSHIRQVDIRQVSAASDSVVSQEIHSKSECGPTIVPTLAAMLQTASEVVQPKPRDYCYTDSLPPVGGCLDSPSIDTPEAGESGMEMAGGNLPADIDICVVPDVLQTAISVRAVVIDTPDAVVSEKWPVEVLRPELTLAEVQMRYRQRYL